MSQTFKNCCTGGNAGDLTQQIVTAAESLAANAAKLNTFTNGSETATVNLGGVTTKSVRGMVKEFRDPMTGYVAQAAASATAANASKAAAANSATAASASKVDAANSAATASGKASQAAQSAASASASAASAKYYADSLKNDLDHINGTLDAHEQRLADLDWTPWGIAITAAREARIAMQQALHDYRTDLELERVAQVTAANAQELADLSWAPWAAAITAVRSAASAMRQAMEIFRLYRLVEALSAGGGSGGSLFFVPE